VAMEEGMRFAIREGGKTVGAGVVTKIAKWRYEIRNYTKIQKTKNTKIFNFVFS
jgi:hypothetical protein